MRLNIDLITVGALRVEVGPWDSLTRKVGNHPPDRFKSTTDQPAQLGEGKTLP